MATLQPYIIQKNYPSTANMSAEEEQSQYDELAGGPGAPTPLQQLEVSWEASPCRQNQA